VALRRIPVSTSEALLQWPRPYTAWFQRFKSGNAAHHLGVDHPSKTINRAGFGGALPDPTVHMISKQVRTCDCSRTQTSHARGVPTFVYHLLMRPGWPPFCSSDRRNTRLDKTPHCPGCCFLDCDVSIPFARGVTVSRKGTMASLCFGIGSCC
jgi:hypothetical protein